MTEAQWKLKRFNKFINLMGLFSLSSQIDTKSVRTNSYIKYITEC